jgi:Zn-dependent M28 family amino/carboxypeptidase
VVEPAVPGAAARELVNLSAVIPGASPDLIVLAAPYATKRFDSFEFVGANDGASAPALLLELARMIQARPLPYTTWLAFLDGEAGVAAGADAAPAHAGSSALARELLSGTAAPPVRLLVMFQQVGDADLHVTRDLRSHRLFREEFWFAAARIGKQEAFRPGDPFESPAGSHLPFIEAGLRGVVLITDAAYGSGSPPGAYANSEDDTEERCSAQSLASVGLVTLETLDRISARLAKIDRFSQPRRAPGEPPAASEAPSAAPAGPEAAPPVPQAAPPSELAPSASPAPAPAQP